MEHADLNDTASSAAEKEREKGARYHRSQQSVKLYLGSLEAAPQFSCTPSPHIE